MNHYEGTEVLNVRPQARIRIKCVSSFTVLGILDNKPVCSYGPPFADQRELTFRPVHKQIKVMCAKGVLWFLEELWKDYEMLDPNPIEIPMDMRAPPDSRAYDRDWETTTHLWHTSP